MNEKKHQYKKIKHLEQELDDENLINLVLDKMIDISDNHMLHHIISNRYF